MIMRYSIKNIQKKKLLETVYKAIATGCTIAQAFIAAWPYIQPYINNIVN